MSDRELEAQPAGQDDEIDAIAASLDVEDGAEQAPAEQAPEGEQSPDAETAPQPEETPEPEHAPEPAETPEPEHAPEPAETPAIPDVAESGFLGAIDEPFATGAPTWPFVVYEGVWAVFAAAIVLMLRDIPEGPLYADRLYAASVVAGLALTGLGPILIIVVWLLSGGTRKGQRGSVFVSSLLKGAVATFLGVVLWIVALVVLDQLRLGSVL